MRSRKNSQDVGTETSAAVSVLASALAVVALTSKLTAAQERPAAAHEQAASALQAVIDSQLMLIARMLQDESVRRVRNIGDGAAVTRLNDAESAYGEAVNARDHHQYKMVGYYADEALRLASQANRDVASRTKNTEMWKARYKDVRGRVMAYRNAFSRVLSEDSRARATALPDAELDQRTAKVEDLARDADAPQLQKVLDANETNWVRRKRGQRWLCNKDARISRGCDDRPFARIPQDGYVFAMTKPFCDVNDYE